MRSAELNMVSDATWREMSRKGGEWDRKRVAALVFDLDILEIPIRLVGARVILEHLAEEYPDQIRKVPDRLFVYEVIPAPSVVKVIASRGLLEQVQAKSGLDSEAAVEAALRSYLARLDA